MDQQGLSDLTFNELEAKVAQLNIELNEINQKIMAQEKIKQGIDVKLSDLNVILLFDCIAKEIIEL